ncbi:MAG TPA: YdjY domain-containing protein [Kiritimatiellia bacterium]|nr:YdjY domain-containing protein [Kiritimatiellia bacterium]HRZ13151.1 YdjY domain-containing protein [Kiritimatiellia bacterium]HSA17572.1 YdjY domain-containing protein [Kiritimatiellia bacterium]
MNRPLSILPLLAAATLAAAGEPAPTAPAWKDGIATLGSVRVDPTTRTVLATGWVNQVSGAIELLACGKGGKTHESVFVLDLNPLDLQTGLLLLGLKPGTPPEGLGQPGAAGPALDIWVDWELKGKRRSLPAERFIRNVERNRPLKQIPWLFTGSMFEDGEFKALAEESLVVTYWDPWAIVNIGDPAGSNDEILVVNDKLVPPLNTPVTLRFRPRQR